jgi:hypothetical protein
MMDADEKDIFRYLCSDPENFIPVSLICRHAGGKHRHRAAPDWAKPALIRMTERGILETDALGSYRLKSAPAQNNNAQCWVSPQIAALLRKNNKKYEQVIRQEYDLEAYYDSL